MQNRYTCGMRSIILIAHDIRSCHNVGSLLRTAEGLGVEYVYLTGYTPYPALEHDTRLPHIAHKLHKQIQKTALGAEISQPWQHMHDIHTVLAELRGQGYAVIGLEQAPHSIPLHEYHPPQKVAIVLGREVEGIDPSLLEQLDTVVEIPMFGSKESFNVVQAAAMTLYQCRFAAQA